MPREDATREKAVRQWAALQDLDLARVSNPKMGHFAISTKCGGIRCRRARDDNRAAGREALRLLRRRAAGIRGLDETPAEHRIPARLAQVERRPGQRIDEPL